MNNKVVKLNSIDFMKGIKDVGCVRDKQLLELVNIWHDILMYPQKMGINLVYEDIANTLYQTDMAYHVAISESSDMLAIVLERTLNKIAKTVNLDDSRCRVLCFFESTPDLDIDKSMQVLDTFFHEEATLVTGIRENDKEQSATSVILIIACCQGEGHLVTPFIPNAHYFTLFIYIDIK